MFELEIQRQRAAILRGIAASSRKMLSDKAKREGWIAISKNEKIQVLRVKKSMLA